MTQLCLSFPASRKKEKLSFLPSNFFGQLKLLSTETRRKLQTSLLFSHYLCILGIPLVLIENGTLHKGAAKLERKTFLISSYTLTHHFVYIPFWLFADVRILRRATMAGNAWILDLSAGAVHHPGHRGYAQFPVCTDLLQRVWTAGRDRVLAAFWDLPGQCRGTGGLLHEAERFHL